MAIELLFARKSPGRIGKLTLDATLSERHAYANDITSFPIESGSSISDHVIQMPEEVEIEGFVTNTPIEFMSGLRSGRVDNVASAYLVLLDIAGYKYPNEIYYKNKLEKISDSDSKGYELIDILTSLRLYDNMGLIRLDIPRDAKTGDVVKFTASFRRVKLVDVVNVPRIVQQISKDVPRAKQQEAAPVDAGKSGTGKLESIPDKIVDKLLGRVD